MLGRGHEQATGFFRTEKGKLINISLNFSSLRCQGRKKYYRNFFKFYVYFCNFLNFYLYFRSFLNFYVYVISIQDLAKLLEDQHGYIDLQNISDSKYYSMDQNPDEEEKL